MTTLIALGLRLVLLAAFTFVFVVLFEHGSANFGENAKKEWELFLNFTRSFSSSSAENPPAPAPEPAPVATPAPTPEPVAVEPTPQPTPTPDQAPTAWETLQNRPIGEGINQPIGGTPAP